jgi:hypothetical protein
MDLSQFPGSAGVTPPTQPSSFYGKSSGGGSTLMWVLIGLLGVGTVVFAILTVVAFGQASTAKNTLSKQKQAAADAARTEQKKTDERAAEIAAESPFRSYVAPIEYGSFEIKFPKNWSSWVDEERSSGTQVNLIVHPDFIRKTNNLEELMAARVTLQQKTLNEFLRPYEANKKVTRADITVSGVKGVQITGQFSDKRTSRIVVVPIRDKSLVFTNEASQYNAEFDQILAQSKVVP